MNTFLLLSFCTDNQSTHQKEAKELERTLMTRMIQHIRPDIKNSITANDSADDPCDWGKAYSVANSEFTIRCASSHVQEIVVDSFYHMLSLVWAPSTVQVIQLTHSDQRRRFSIRRLPRSARSVDISINRFYGDLDFSALPSHMEYFIAGENEFAGNITLDRLPANMIEISLTSNPICVPVLYYGQLPERMSYINVHSCGVKAMKPINKRMKDAKAIAGVGAPFVSHRVVDIDVI